jgi:hypothetical protein
MDAVRFDALARALSRLGSRRGLLAAALGGATTLSGRDAAAICRKGGADCTRDRQCCSERCLGNGTCSCRKASGRSVGCKPPEDRCQKTTCSSTGRCVESPKKQGAPCGTGTSCDASAKCVASCEDGVKTPGTDETDVDCGGSCPTKCANGKACTNSDGSDCASGNCCGDTCRECCETADCNGNETGTDGDPQRVCGELDRLGQCCEQMNYFYCLADETVVDNCGVKHDACPAPVTKPDTPGECCENSTCTCDGVCCGQGDACYVADNNSEEYCCLAKGETYKICGDYCCPSGCDESGVDCHQQSGRLGSYRRGPIG